jgi:hypothetical protein
MLLGVKIVMCGSCADQDACELDEAVDNLECVLAPTLVHEKCQELDPSPHGWWSAKAGEVPSPHRTGAV